MKGDYSKETGLDSFYIAQTMRASWIRQGYQAPPVLAIERELLRARAHIFLYKRRKRKLEVRYVKNGIGEKA